MMKAIPVILSTVLGFTALATASSLHIVGDVTWGIKKPNCIFKLGGTIQNLSPGKTNSGNIRLVLLATSAPFPASGHTIATYELGSLPGRYQFDPFQIQAPAEVPNVTGAFYFTIALQEKSSSGWHTVDYTSSAGTQLLDKGELITGKKWAIPLTSIIQAPNWLRNSYVVSLTPKASGRRYRLSPGTRSKTKITLQSSNKATIAI